MICQSCNQNLATVHLTEIVQKTKRETHLCEDCARTKGVTYDTQFSVKDFLGGLGEKKEPQAAKAEEPALALPAAAPTGPGPCPSCGITFTEFRQTGRLGCHLDYEHFREGLTPLLEKIHGATQHTGRMPASIGQRLERQRLLSRYHKELQEAVVSENYERAADLRDKIRGLEEARERA